MLADEHNSNSVGHEVTRGDACFEKSLHESDIRNSLGNSVPSRPTVSPAAEAEHENAIMADAKAAVAAGGEK